MVEIPPTGLFFFTLLYFGDFFFRVLDLFASSIILIFPFVFLEVDVWPKICPLPFEGLVYSIARGVAPRGGRAPVRSGLRRGRYGGGGCIWPGGAH